VENRNERRARRARRRTGRAATAALLSALISAGCTTSQPVATWAPTDCLARDEPVSRYRLETADVPGFKQPVMVTAVEDALGRIGWRRVDDGEADVTVHLRVSLIRLDAPAAAPDDPLGEPGASSAQARFVGHADLEITEGTGADGALLWKGAMERMHRVSGAADFHSERATSLIDGALTELVLPLQRRCE
jgi:hypothetical protein